MQPEHVDAHLGLAISLFRLGCWEEAWHEYEWRLRHPSLNQPALPGNAWTGQPIAGRTILVRAEQGLGDTLQFVRYLPKLKEQGAKVVLQCQRALHALFANFAGIDELVAPDQPMPRYDEHVALLSLPGIFGTTLDNVPAAIPYLQADAAAVARWRSKLAADAGFKIGIAWQGSLANPRDAVRSIPLAQFAPLAALPGVCLYSLQHGAGSEQIESLRDADFP